MELKKGYKNTEIGVIPVDWEVKKLGEVGEVAMCKRIFSYETKKSGSIPFYKIGTFGKEADAYISEELYNNYRKRFSFPKKGDILISASGTIGRTIVYDGKPSYFQDSNIVWIENDEKLIPNKFLYYVLQVIDYNSEGSTIQRLYNSIIKNAKFILPPLPEQTAIATVLSDTDNLIQALEKKIAKKQLIKKGAMQKLLSPKEDWVVKTLGEVGKCFRGVSYNSEKDLYDYDNKNTYRLLRSNNIQSSKIDINNVQFVDSLRVSQNQIMKKNDILICMANGSKTLVGKAAQLNESDSYKYTFGAFMGCFKVLESNYNPNYIFYNFLSHNYRSHINLLLSGSSINNLKPSDIESIEIPIPKSIQEQTRIATILSDMDAEIETLEKKLAKYKQIKQGLMQVLLTGKIRLV